jgi:hypothetical protein
MTELSDLRRQGRPADTQLMQQLKDELTVANDEAARSTHLLDAERAKNTKLTGEVAVLTQLLDVATTAPDATPVFEATTTGRDSETHDPAFTSAIDTRAKTIFEPLRSNWDKVHAMLAFQEKKGLEAINASLAERLLSVMEQSGQYITDAHSQPQPWTIDSPVIQAMIAHHYASLLKRAPLRQETVSTIDTSINRFKDRVNMPNSKIVTQVLQILLYSNPDNLIRERCFKFLKANNVNERIAANIIGDFYGETGLTLNKYLERIFEGTK